MLNSKSTIVLFALVGAFVVANGEKYSDQYDYIKTDAILANSTERNQWFDCFIGKAACPNPESSFFKSILGEMLATKCEKCTEKQKIALNKFVTYYTENEPEKYKVLTDKLFGSQKPL